MVVLGSSPEVRRAWLGEGQAACLQAAGERSQAMPTGPGTRPVHRLGVGRVGEGHEDPDGSCRLVESRKDDFGERGELVPLVVERVRVMPARRGARFDPARALLDSPLLDVVTSVVLSPWSSVETRSRTGILDHAVGIGRRASGDRRSRRSLRREGSAAPPAREPRKLSERRDPRVAVQSAAATPMKVTPQPVMLRSGRSPVTARTGNMKMKG
jgi:hypothetical protein